jgi:uncharacterized protein (DUF2225 family)
MKLSDEKLTKLLTPLITKEVEAYGLEKLTIEGKLDQSGDDAIYINIWARDTGKDQNNLFLHLSDVVRDALQDKDERIFHYVWLHSRVSHRDSDLKELMQLINDMQVAA